MSTISDDIRDRLINAEEAIVAKFNDMAENGAVYRAAHTSDEIDSSYQRFKKLGYDIQRCAIVDDLDNTIRYKLILLRDGNDIAQQDISVAINIGIMTERFNPCLVEDDE